jgi:hypothetical protein
MTSPDQLNLFNDRQQETQDRQVQWLESFLNEHPVWHTAAMIQRALGGLATEDGARKIRMLAQASPWIISGQKGYKHLSRATPEEINHFVNWMESQAREMTRRAETVKRNAHRIFG